LNLIKSFLITSLLNRGIKHVVTGKSTSIHITEGQVDFGGKSFRAAIFTDTKTRKQLAVEGKPVQ
jgi:hypothetical protein